MQVMLGVSLRARWDATLVSIMEFANLLHSAHDINFTFYCCWVQSHGYSSNIISIKVRILKTTPDLSC